MSKIGFSGEGTGWWLIPGILWCVIAVAWCGMADGMHTRATVVLPAAGLFFGYFVLRLAADSASTADFVAYTSNYSNGVIFAFVFGLGCSLFINAIAGNSVTAWSWAAGIGLMILNLLQMAQIGLAAIPDSQISKGTFLYAHETYQNSAFLMSATTIIIACVVVRTQPHGVGIAARVQRTVQLAITGAFFCGGAILTQFLGSNAGPAFIVPIGVLTIGCLMTQGRPHSANRDGDGSLPPAIPTKFSNMALRCTTKCALIVVLIVLSGFSAVATDWIQLSSLRLFQFSDELSINDSALSRWDILINNFWTHQAHSPIFGQMFVDRLTTGEGTYVHSLIAIGPHLGVVGVLLFLFLCWAAVLRLRQMWLMSRFDPSNAQFVLLSIGLLGWALMFTMFGNFFTAIQVWFSFGLLVPPLILAFPSRKGSHRDARSNLDRKFSQGGI